MRGRKDLKDRKGHKAYKDLQVLLGRVVALLAQQVLLGHKASKAGWEYKGKPEYKEMMVFRAR
jgi:hypothetical protein